MDIRSLFIEYFIKNGHRQIESSSLVPASDKTLLFTNSGMVQFKDIFLGVKSSKNKKIVTCQKCVRAGGKHNDLENIGYTNRHHSFFEMLGNFSFGDYFKEEAISLAWDFLTKELKLDESKLYISVHKDDKDAANIWLSKIKIKPEKIWYLDDIDNFWQMAPTGPCGPCSEIYYDLGDKLTGSIPTKGDTGDRFIEIWNLVFTQFDRDSKNILHDLPKKCVDTGMGLERIHAVVEGKTDNFQTSLFTDLENYLDKSLNTKNINYTIKKIIMDHCRSSCFLISDGVIPSNEGRGYVLRRIIRRATRFLYNAGIKEPFIYTCSDILKKTMGEQYQALTTKNETIKETLKSEEENYLSTLSNGLELINKLTKNKNELSGENIFKLYDTFGFPSEIIQEIAMEKKLKLDLDKFKILMSKQKTNSRKSSNFDLKDTSFIDKKRKTIFSEDEEYLSVCEVISIYRDRKKITSFSQVGANILVALDKTPFYPEGGGQISDIGIMSNEKCSLEVMNVQKIDNIILHTAKLLSGSIDIGQLFTTKIDRLRRNKISVNHSSTHLLNQALRDTLGDHVEQKGSLVTDKYLRFDFTHRKPLTVEEIGKLESLVNFEISTSRDTQQKNMPYEQAVKDGALAFFDEKYEDEVRVISIGTKSMELCGGTHIKNTSVIRLFKILSETGISTGVRRIEAITADEALGSYQKIYSDIKDISRILNSNVENLYEKILMLKDKEVKNVSSIEKLNKRISALYLDKLANKLSTKSDTACFLADCSDLDTCQIKIILDLIKSKYSNSLSALLQKKDGLINCYVGVSKNCKHSYNAKKIISELNKTFNSKGGGSETFGTSVISNQSTDVVIDYLDKLLLD